VSEFATTFLTALVGILITQYDVGWENMDWIFVAQDWDKCRVLISNFRPVLYVV